MQHTPKANKLQKMFGNFLFKSYTNRINVYFETALRKDITKKIQ